MRCFARPSRFFAVKHLTYIFDDTQHIRTESGSGWVVRTTFNAGFLGEWLAFVFAIECLGNDPAATAPRFSYWMVLFRLSYAQISTEAVKEMDSQRREMKHLGPMQN